MTYWDNLERHDGGACIDEIWLSHPLVRAEVNRRVSGDPKRWPTQWLREQIHETIANSVSIGCGTGAFERDVAGQHIVEKITGIDLAPQPLARARELAAPFGSRISYEQADAFEFLRGKTFDAIFFHQSLHHVQQLEDLLAGVHEWLKPDGLLYLNEYIGPSRTTWSDDLIAPHRAIFDSLPAETKATPDLPLPIQADDPSEAVRSDEIVTVLQEHFEIEAFRGYGGNLLSVLFPNLRREALTAELVDTLIGLDEAMTATDASPYYAVMVARPIPR